MPTTRSRINRISDEGKVKRKKIRGKRGVANKSGGVSGIKSIDRPFRDQR